MRAETKQRMRRVVVMANLADEVGALLF